MAQVLHHHSQPRVKDQQAFTTLASLHARPSVSARCAFARDTLSCYCAAPMQGRSPRSPATNTAAKCSACTLSVNPRPRLRVRVTRATIAKTVAPLRTLKALDRAVELTARKHASIAETAPVQGDATAVEPRDGRGARFSWRRSTCRKRGTSATCVPSMWICGGEHVVSVQREVKVRPLVYPHEPQKSRSNSPPNPNAVDLTTQPRTSPGASTVPSTAYWQEVVTRVSQPPRL